VNYPEESIQHISVSLQLSYINYNMYIICILYLCAKYSVFFYIRAISDSLPIVVKPKCEKGMLYVDSMSVHSFPCDLVSAIKTFGGFF